jgi:hypothetical protein
MRSIWQTFEKRVDMTRYVPAQDIINSAQGGISSHKIDPRSLKTPKISRCAGLRARFARPAARASLAQLSPRKKGLNHVPLAHPDRGSSPQSQPRRRSVEGKSCIPPHRPRGVGPTHFGSNGSRF